VNPEGSWWRHGVIYHIYPRSFSDANRDGIGDLEGIRARLDYLAWLGINAIWISPCFPSPLVDFGYDVSDYCDIGPEFGSLADFDRLVADAQAKGIRILLDLVPNHTSDQHPWFLESRRSRDSAKRDWYLWRDPAPDGGPPNNWVSVFGGSPWEWDTKTGQYYLHSFFKQQPDLNWRNPEVRRAIHDVMRFWLDRGVAGFRIDVIQRILKDPDLRDNPVIEAQDGASSGGQRHVNDENHPDVHAAVRELRKLADAYGDRLLVGEVFILDPAEVAKYYGRNDELHLAFNFTLLTSRWSAEAFRRELERFEAALPPSAWPDLVLSNHDAPRHASRYDHPELGEARARVAAMFLLTARGTPFLYYGEEIGMRQQPIPEAQMQDPIARTLHPTLCRDGARTPMQWTSEKNGGFSQGPPWLPLGSDFAERNVEAQRADRGSLLNLYRELLALRRRVPALHRGEYRTLDAPEGVLAYEREYDGRRARIALNFADTPRRLSLGSGQIQEALHSAPGAVPPAQLERVELQAAEGVVLVLR
jgi:alpha-glucosidase